MHVEGTKHSYLQTLKVMTIYLSGTGNLRHILQKDRSLTCIFSYLSTTLAFLSAIMRMACYFCADLGSNSTAVNFLYSLGDDSNASNFSTIFPILTTTDNRPRVHYGPVLRLTPSHEVLKAQLKWGFLLHTYGFACLFFILAFYAFFSILNLR